MKILNKIKDLFKKPSKLPVNDNYTIPAPIGEVHYFDFKYEEPLSKETKIAAQKIGLDLVDVKHDPNIVMTSGYLDFKEDIKLSPEEILFQMKKVKRASEKVLDKMIETETKFNKSLEYYKHKAEHKEEHKQQPKIAKPKAKHVK
jgi:hypothetical protein